VCLLLSFLSLWEMFRKFDEKTNQKGLMRDPQD
jgi:hypothetical protein